MQKCIHIFPTIFHFLRFPVNYLAFQSFDFDDYPRNSSCPLMDRCLSFVIFRLTFVLHVILLFTASDYHFGIFKLFSLNHVIFSIQENKQRFNITKRGINMIYQWNRHFTCLYFKRNAINVFIFSLPFFISWDFR
jgi:hypothetical protein